MDILCKTFDVTSIQEYLDTKIITPLNTLAIDGLNQFSVEVERFQFSTDEDCFKLALFARDRNLLTMKIYNDFTDNFEDRINKLVENFIVNVKRLLVNSDIISIYLIPNN